MYKIREIRIQKKYTQEYMANVLDISLKTYSNIELGNSELSINKLFHISETLQTPLEHFFGGNFHSNYTDCVNSGHQHSKIFNNEGYQEAIKAKDETIKIQAEMIVFLKKDVK